ncbi:hypothetical protein [Streptomyces pseudogriseolus]|uniref:hypothetical protein n=1 Tax=Streptomyces pseudogriseolus TaxID=36817 RepID=UPI003FA1E87F
MLKSLAAFLHQPRTIACLVFGTITVLPLLVWTIIAPGVPTPLRVASWIVTPVLLTGFAAAVVCSLRLVSSRTSPSGARSSRP